MGFTRGRESTCQCRRHKRCGFDPWVGKIPWRRAWQPTLVFLPEESHGKTWQAIVHRVSKSRTWLKRLSVHTHHVSLGTKFNLKWKLVIYVYVWGNQPWIFIGKTYAEAEAPMLWPPDEKSQSIGKDPNAGKEWRQKEKGVTGDEMVGWPHWLNGRAFEQALGHCEGQGSLACCSLWSPKSWTRLNNNNM